jgi:hypothetical protein
VASADAGSARTTTNAPDGNDPNRARIRCRSRRCTRCRTTEPPTVRPTTKPTRGGNPTASTSLSRARCTTTEPQPARRPRRTAVAKSSRRVSRVAAGNNGTDPRNASGRQLRTALAAPGRDDRTARAGAHAQPEPVGPRAATVVRLERALALTHGCHSPGAGCSVGDCGVAAVGTASCRRPTGTGGTSARRPHPVSEPDQP